MLKLFSGKYKKLLTQEAPDGKAIACPLSPNAAKLMFPILLTIVLKIMWLVKQLLMNTCGKCISGLI